MTLRLFQQTQCTYTCIHLYIIFMCIYKYIFYYYYDYYYTIILHFLLLLLLLLLCCFSYVWPYGSSHIRSIALGISQSPWGDRGAACWCPCLRSQAWRNEGQARAPGLYPMCMYVHTYTTYIYIYTYIYVYLYIYNIYIYISDVDLFHHRSYQWDPWNTILDAIRGRMKSHHPALRGSCWDHGMPGSSLLFIFFGRAELPGFWLLTAG